MAILDPAALQEKIVPAILQLANDKTWRIRIAVVTFFPKLARLIDKESFSSKIEPQLINMMMDPVFSIREEAAKTLIELSKSPYDRDWLDNLIGLKIEDFSKHQTFMIRIHCVHLMNSMRPYVSQAVISQKFGPIFIKLAADPVPNIRFNVSKSIKYFWANWGRATQMELESILKKQANDDPDFDAKFFAGKALQEVNLK